MGERLGQGLRQGAGQAGENLALHLAREIGARPPRGEEKLRDAGVALIGHDSSMTKARLGPQGNRRTKVYGSECVWRQPPISRPGYGPAGRAAPPAAAQWRACGWPKHWDLP